MDRSQVLSAQILLLGTQPTRLFISQELLQDLEWSRGRSRPSFYSSLPFCYLMNIILAPQGFPLCVPESLVSSSVYPWRTTHPQSSQLFSDLARCSTFLLLTLADGTLQSLCPSIISSIQYNSWPILNMMVGTASTGLS